MHAPVPLARLLYRPMGQVVHTVMVDARTTFEYIPAEHAVHEEVPVVRELYVPTTHEVHTVDELAPATVP